MKMILFSPSETLMNGMHTSVIMNKIVIGIV